MALFRSTMGNLELSWRKFSEILRDFPNFPLLLESIFWCISIYTFSAIYKMETRRGKKRKVKLVKLFFQHVHPVLINSLKSISVFALHAIEP